MLKKRIKIGKWKTVFKGFLSIFGLLNYAGNSNKINRKQLFGKNK